MVKLNNGFRAEIEIENGPDGPVVALVITAVNGAVTKHPMSVDSAYDLADELQEALVPFE